MTLQDAGWSTAERAIFRKLKTPYAIQQYLDEGIGYNLEPRGATCYSPRSVLKYGVAHCMEGALFAAAALRMLGYPPLLVDLEAVRDSDHVLPCTAATVAGVRWRNRILRDCVGGSRCTAPSASSR